MGQNAGYGGPVMCCIGGTDADAVQFCKDYISRLGLTREYVKIVQKNYMTLVIAVAKPW